MVLFSTGGHFILGCLTCFLVKIIPSEVQNAELDERGTQTNQQINRTTQLNFISYHDQRKIVAYIDNHSDDSTEYDDSRDGTETVD